MKLEVISEETFFERTISFHEEPICLAPVGGIDQSYMWNLLIGDQPVPLPIELNLPMKKKWAV